MTTAANEKLTLIQQRDELLDALKCARGAIRRIKKTTNRFDESRQICILADKKASNIIDKIYSNN